MAERKTAVWYEEQKTPEERRADTKEGILVRLLAGTSVRARDFGYKQADQAEFFALVREVAEENHIKRWNQGVFANKQVTPT